MTMTQRTLRVDEVLWAAAQDKAKTDGVTVSALLIGALERYVAGSPQARTGSAPLGEEPEPSTRKAPADRHVQAALAAHPGRHRHRPVEVEGTRVYRLGQAYAMFRCTADCPDQLAAQRRVR